jgi:ectoine hydrolase
MKRHAFSQQEYVRRRAAVRDALGSHGLDAVALSSPANITYLTGYPACGSAYVPQCLVYDAIDDKLVFLCRPMDSVGALAMSILTEAEVATYPEALVGGGAGQLETFLFQRIAERLPGRAVGLECGHLSASALAIANSVLHACRDVSGLVNWVRLVKSKEELAVHREAAAISDLAMRAAVRTADVGVREADVAAAIMHALCRGTDTFGGDWPSHPEIPSGPRLRAPHLSWVDDVYRPGSQINCELGGWRFRYVSPLARTISIGAPDERLRHLHDATVEAAETILPMLRPGVSCSEIWRCFNSAISRYGYRKLSRCGYAIGLEWDGGTASFQNGDSTLLCKDMTFHLMLGMWEDPNASCVLSETLAISDNGAEVFGRTPRKILLAGEDA